MTADEMQPGEIQRTLARIEGSVESLRVEVRDRHHELANQVNDKLGPISAHGVRIDALERKYDALDGRVDGISTQANKIAGAGALLAVLAGMFSGWWKH